MKIKIWTATVDNGDGSSSVFMYPTEEALRNDLHLDEDDFAHYGVGTDDEWQDEVPTEVDFTIFDATNCEVIN